MKKTYVAPKTQTVYLHACGILAASNGKKERYTYHCPYIPETKCELYDEFVVRKIGANKGSLKTTTEGRTFMSADVHCPYRNDCEDYDLYCKITNERQR